MEAAFVLARCFPISCSRGAAYTGLHRLAVATQASCFGGLLYGSLQFHFFSFRYFVALCIIFLDFFWRISSLYVHGSIHTSFWPHFTFFNPIFRPFLRGRRQSSCSVGAPTPTPRCRFYEETLWQRLQSAKNAIGLWTIGYFYEVIY